MEENIENKEIIDNFKTNNIKTSNNNNNQSLKLNNNDNPVKIQISNDEEKDKVDSKYNNDNDNDNDNELNKKDNFQISISLNIQSNFMSANSQYVKHINTLASIKTKSKNNDIKEKNNKYANIDHLQPLIHFTNLSNKNLKILASNSKTKTESNNK